MDENTENYFGLGYRRQSETHRTRSHTNQSKAIMLIKQSLVEMINISWWWRSNELTCIISTGTLSSIKKSCFWSSCIHYKEKPRIQFEVTISFLFNKTRNTGSNGTKMATLHSTSSWIFQLISSFLSSFSFFFWFRRLFGPRNRLGFRGNKKKEKKEKQNK